MPKSLTEDQLLKIVAQMVKEAGSQYRAAEVLKVTQGFLCDVLHKRRYLGEKIPHALGYERVITYRKQGE